MDLFLAREELEKINTKRTLKLKGTVENWHLKHNMGWVTTQRGDIRVTYRDCLGQEPVPEKAAVELEVFYALQATNCRKL